MTPDQEKEMKALHDTVEYLKEQVRKISKCGTCDGTGTIGTHPWGPLEGNDMACRHCDGTGDRFHDVY